MGPWAHGLMGPWAHGPMAHGPMLKYVEDLLLARSRYDLASESESPPPSVSLTAKGPKQRFVWQRRKRGEGPLARSRRDLAGKRSAKNHVEGLCCVCLDTILSFSGALFCFRASGAQHLRHIFLDRPPGQTTHNNRNNNIMFE